MVNLHTKNPNFCMFCRPRNAQFWCNVLPFGIVSPFVYFSVSNLYLGGIRSHDPWFHSPWWKVETTPVDHAAKAIWYILWLFGTYISILVCYTKNNLATLIPNKRHSESIKNDISNLRHLGAHQWRLVTADLMVKRQQSCRNASGFFSK
jgi:hypothetical protein